MRKLTFEVFTFSYLTVQWPVGIMANTHTAAVQISIQTNFVTFLGVNFGLHSLSIPCFGLRTTNVFRPSISVVVHLSQFIALLYTPQSENDLRFSLLYNVDFHFLFQVLFCQTPMPPRRKRRLCADMPRVNGRFTRRTIVHVANNEVQMNDGRSSLLENVATGIITEDTTYLHHVKATDEYCHSCFRCSTHQFPILLTSVSTQFVQRRRYGSKTVNSISILLCMHCNVFRNKQHDLFQLSKPLFKYAWPSVIWYFLSMDEQDSATIWNHLPDTLRLSWYHLAALQNRCFMLAATLVVPSVFADATAAIDDIQSFQLFWRGDDMMKKLNQHFFPCVKCPVGCWSFPEKCSLISFKHYLQLLYPTFKSFDADAQRHFVAKRSDYEIPDTFFSLSIQASVAVQQFELTVLVCHRHKDKLHLNIIHPPRSPFGRMFSSGSDKFAPAVLASHHCLPFSENSSTSSYKMYPLSGSYQGASTCFLTEERRFDNYNAIQCSHENHYLQHRPDAVATLNNLALEGKVSQEYVHQIMERVNKSPTMDENNDMQWGGNAIPLESVCFLQLMETMRRHADLQHESNENNLLQQNLINESSRLFLPCVKPMSRNEPEHLIFVKTPNLATSYLFFFCCNNVMFMYSLLTTPSLTHDLLTRLLKCFRRHIVLPTVKEKRSHQELSNVQSHLTFHNFTEMCMSFRGFQISNVRHSSEIDVPSQNLPFINFIHVTASDNLFTARSQPQLILSIGGVHFRLIFVQIRNSNFFCSKFCNIWS